jgi:hypothetical protein
MGRAAIKSLEVYTIFQKIFVSLCLIPDILQFVLKVLQSNNVYCSTHKAMLCVYTHQCRMCY